MQLPNWTRNLLSRRRRRRERSARRELLEPVRLSLRKLEERRVLDVSAAFMTETGLLTVDVTNTEDIATLTNDNGDVAIRDSGNNAVDIEVNSGGSGRVRMSDVRRIVVSGDAATNQRFVLETPVVLRDGFRAASSIEVASINNSITRVDTNGIELDSLEVNLGANLEAEGLGVVFAGNVSLTDNVTLIGEDIIFAGMVNDDGDANTGSSLLVNASGLTRFEAEVGGLHAIDSLRTDAPGHSEINADITAIGNTITFNDPVLLTNSVHVTDSGSTGIRFNDTVDSEADAQHSLTATAANGDIRFSGDIGNGGAGDQSLGTLTITEAADGVIFGDKAGVAHIRTDSDINIGSVATIGGVGIQLDGGAANLLTVTTNGGQSRWNGPTALFTDVDMRHAGKITFTAAATIDSQPNAVRKLRVMPTSSLSQLDIDFGADIGASVPLAGLEVLGATNVNFGGSIAEIRSTRDVLIEAVNLSFDAGDGNTLQLTTTGDRVRVDGDEVELRSSLSIDTGSGAGDIEITSRVDSQAGERNDLRLNAGDGSVVAERSIGGAEALGTLTVVEANGGVTLGTVGATVTDFRADNGIDIGTGSNAIGGAGITLFDTHRFTTDGGDIRFNGALGLNFSAFGFVRFDTGTGAGDVIFTNDTPITSNDAGSLTVRPGTGTTRFNEDISATGERLALSVVSEGEVFFGEAFTELAGSGTTGPVATINVRNLEVTTPQRTVFTGSAAGGTSVSSDQDIRFSGPVELATDVRLETLGTDRRVVFGSSATIDSAAGRQSSLDIRVPDGNVFFNANIGGTNPLDRLTITTPGHVAFGGAPDSVAGPVNLVHALNGIDVGVGTAPAGVSSFFASGIALDGGNETLDFRTRNGDVRFNGALRVQSDVLINTAAGGGDILLTSAATLNSDDGSFIATSNERNDVTIDAGTGRVSINADIGATQRLGSLIVQRAAGGVEIGGADTAVAGGQGPVSQILTDGPIEIGSVEQIAGGIAFNGGGAALAIETSADNIALNGPVELRTNVAIDTGAGGGDLNLSVNSRIVSQAGEANDLKVMLDTGSATFQAAVGETNALGELRFMSANDVSFQASVTAARIAQDAGSGTTHFAGSIGTTDAARIGIELAGTNFVFDAALTTAGDGRVSITHAGLLDINNAADMRLAGSFREDGGGNVETAASIITTGDTISFGSPLTLTDGAAADVLFDTTDGGNSVGADIAFGSTLDGESDGAEALTLITGDSADVLFGGAIGETTRLGPLQIVSANDLTASGSIRVTRISQAAGSGATTFNGTIDTNDAAERGIDINAADVNLNAAVMTTGDGRVEITVTGLLDIADAADMNLSGSFLQDGGGSVRTAADITTSDDDITFTDAVVAADDLRFDTGSGPGTVRFDSTLDGTTDCQDDLHFATGGGDIEFAGAVGDQVGLGDVTISVANDVTFASSLRSNSIVQTGGTGETRFDGPVTIKGAAGTSLATANVTISGTFDSSANNGPLLLDVTDGIHINSHVTTGMGTVELLADDDVAFGNAARVTTDGATITVVADADTMPDAGSGGGVTLADGAILNSGDAVIGIFADENITLGRLVTTGAVTLTSISGSIVDGGNAGGADIVANEVSFQATTGIGTTNPIDTSVNTLAARNELGGGVRIENAAGTTLTIGDSGVLSGVSAGPSQAPAKLGGDIEIIHVGAIDVERPILNDAGGHTRLRAELAGDLTVNAPIQNRGGDGWIFLISGEDLIINDSLPEPQAEISVQNEGAIRGIANEEVIVDNSETNYVIIRTHSERSISEQGLSELPVRFSDPTQALIGLPGSEFYPSNQNTQFYRDLEIALTTIREEVAPQITNVRPVFSIEAVDQGGSDIDERGRGIVQITIGDEFHLERNWHLTIDWGDGNIESFTIPGNPQASLGFFNSSDMPSNIHPDVTITPRLDSGQLNPDGTRSPGVYYVHHTYLSNPNANDPAAPILVTATLRPDARSEGEAILDSGFPSSGSSIFNGIRFIANGTQELLATAQDGLTNPGAGVFFFVKVIESVILPVESRESTVIFVTQTTTTSNVSTSARFEFVVASFEGEAFEEYRLFMRVVDDVANIEGTEEFDLPLTRLDDPLGLFRERTFPNGHYRIYLEEIRTGRVRLILECHIYQGRVVPPNFREGAGERQPGDAGTNIERGPGDFGPAGENNRNPFIDDAPPGANDGAAGANDGAAVPNDGAAVPEVSMMLPLAAAALPWRRRVRRAIAANDRPISRAWMRLQRLRRGDLDS